MWLSQLCAPAMPCTRGPRPALLILKLLTIKTRERQKSLSFSLCFYLHNRVTKAIPGLIGRSRELASGSQELVTMM